MKKLIFFISLILVQQTYALDIITSPYQLLKPCYKPRTFREYSNVLCFTIKSTDNHFGNPTEKASISRIFSYVISLPFFLLDEDHETISFDTKSLRQQGYDDQEINEVKSDIEFIMKEVNLSMHVSPEEVINLLKENNQISEMTIDLLGL